MTTFSKLSHGVIGLMAVAFLASVAPVQAQQVTEDEILKALSPPKTRSLSIGAPTRVAPSGDEVFVDTLRNKSSRDLSASAREKLKTVAADKPAIDLVMEFDFRSDALRGEALRNADALGKALSKPELANQTFVIAGHTDAKGSDAANQTLSERRAEAVKRYLVATYKLPAENLIAVGYGKTKLKNQAAPFAMENRRVQAVNLLQVKTAAR
ncbi:hypothetical protein ASG40_03085 [Methylobacterium sp. Leaf399]|uniref:OmpA family protein n=1 Tax=unclassified Methylobacterium TaxID=2615210 RepID=UPI0006FFE235|nr:MULTISPECIES: OmpA family protein [unclassified Methylobacterium]KQP59711.1 hypothetical protein ASF39_16295 [Methylobacterium sp. Leaf108]KQT19815.1 hypothetical protein ASG40_03085 [Methylobacterium sp. Leaf399]